MIFVLDRQHEFSITSWNLTLFAEVRKWNIIDSISIEISLHDQSEQFSPASKCRYNFELVLAYHPRTRSGILGMTVKIAKPCLRFKKKKGSKPPLLQMLYITWKISKHHTPTYILHDAQLIGQNSLCHKTKRGHLKLSPPWCAKFFQMQLR